MTFLVRTFVRKTALVERSPSATLEVQPRLRRTQQPTFCGGVSGS